MKIKKRFWIPGVAIIAAVTLSLVAFTGSTNTASEEKLPEISQEVIDALTVKTASADAGCVLDANGLVSYQIGALEAVPAPRLWSDAVSTPFAATTPEEIRDELQAETCKDVLLGVSELVFFATDVRDELLSKTGVDLVELNPWLKPFAVDPSEINELAAEFIPLLDVEEPKDSEVTTAIKQNRKWQELASYVNTLYDRFTVSGPEARMSVVNYHLAVGGLVVGGLPAVERNANQEDLPALILSLTEKDQCAPLLTIGANTGDKRPELFGAGDCVTPDTPGTPPAPPTECTENCTQNPPPCTSNCTPPCPPNNMTPSCAPKGGDKKDYEYPEGKPPVTETRPADQAPPVVDTNVGGGGGVVDTPANNPGSETGVTAPDAEPAPTTPTPLPSNEGGDNGAGDTGGF